MSNSITKLSALILIFFTAQLSYAHEDHNSRYGGFVMMFLEMHFEIVVPDNGGLKIYYSNEMRIEMPASVVSDVAVEIERPGGTFESVSMFISDDGGHWGGDSTPIIDPDSIIRLAFLFQGEPFVLDIPASVLPESSNEHSEMIHSV